MTIFYREQDADLAQLVGKTVGIVGYSELGQAFALNLRDSGVTVIVAPYHGDEASIAAEHDIPTMKVADLTRQAQVIVLTLAEETLSNVYIESISPHLQRGHTLIFTSAYTVTFGYIEPPPFVDYGLISPRYNGAQMRQCFTTGESIPAFVAVGQDASRSVWGTVLAVALGAGLLRAGAIEVHFEQEAELSLFIQQAIVPFFYQMMVAAAGLLMKAGYPPEAALQDLYLQGKFHDYLRQVEQQGLLNTVQRESLTGQYSTLSRLNRLNGLQLERLMENILEQIQKGDFAREWAREYVDGHPRLTKLARSQEALDLWDWEQQTIELLDHQAFNENY
jgi:ketol-acid reductoisomerase